MGSLINAVPSKIVCSVIPATRQQKQILFVGANCNEDPKGRCLPTTTSYDHDAPLSEAGDLTVKYWAIRKIVSKVMRHWGW